MATSSSALAKAQRIKALLEGATTEGEAAAAAEALARIMLRNHIEEHELTGKVAENVKSVRVDLGKGGRPNWRRNLLSIVGDAFGCETVYWTGLNDATLIGRQSQIDFVMDTYVTMKATILRLATEGYKAYSEDFTNRGLSRIDKDGWRRYDPVWAPVWNTAFCMGANATIAKRLRAARKGDTKEESALVATIDQAVKDKFNELFPNLKSSYNKRSYDAGAWRSGSEAAAGINLNERSVTSGNRRLKG